MQNTPMEQKHFNRRYGVNVMFESLVLAVKATKVRGDEFGRIRCLCMIWQQKNTTANKTSSAMNL